MSHVALEAEVQARAEHPRTPAARDFEQVFGHWPQAEAQAPGIVHLLGEHTECSDGLMLAAALPVGARVAMRRNGGSRFRLHAAHAGRTIAFTLQDKPQEDFAAHLFGCLRLLHAEVAPELPALDIHVACDIPSGRGLGCSAALAVATLRCVRRLLALPIDDARIAQLAQQVEIQDLGVRCGLADEMACSLLPPGGAVVLDTRTFAPRPVQWPTGVSLLVMAVDGETSLAFDAGRRRAECEEAARSLQLPSLRDVEHLERVEALPDPQRRRARHVFTEGTRALRAMESAGARAFGGLLNASHDSLRDDYEWTTPGLEALVAAMRGQPGVLGARLCSGRSGHVAAALCESGAELEISRAVLNAAPLDHGRARLLVPALP